MAKSGGQMAAKVHEGSGNIVKGRLSGFSLDRLFQCLEALDQRIEVSITPNASCASQAKTVLSW